MLQYIRLSLKMFPYLIPADKADKDKKGYKSKLTFVTMLFRPQAVYASLCIRS